MPEPFYCWVCYIWYICSHESWMNFCCFYFCSSAVHFNCPNFAKYLRIGEFFFRLCFIIVSNALDTNRITDETDSCIFKIVHYLLDLSEMVEGRDGCILLLAKLIVKSHCTTFPFFWLSIFLTTTTKAKNAKSKRSMNSFFVFLLIFLCLSHSLECFVINVRFGLTLSKVYECLQSFNRIDNFCVWFGIALKRIFCRILYISTLTELSYAICIKKVIFDPFLVQSALLSHLHVSFVQWPEWIWHLYHLRVAWTIPHRYIKD